MDLPVTDPSRESTDERVEILRGVLEVLDQALQLGARCRDFDEDTPLLGHIPEMDSMAVLTVLTGIEEYFGLLIDDDDVSAESFETVGSLVDLVVRKST